MVALALINALAKLYARCLGLVRAEEHSGYTLLVVRRLIPRWAAGQVWGECVLVVAPHQNRRGLLAHERVHVAQWRRHGWRFPVLYGWASLMAWWRGEHYYLDNRFEVEARRQSGY